MKILYLVLVLVCIGIIGNVALYSFGEQIILSTTHLGYEIKLCEKYIDYGWDRSPYYYLDCPYPKSNTTCLVNSTESTILQQRIRSIEQTSNGYKIITVEGIPFDIQQKITLDDTITIQKHWKTFNKTTTEITTDKQVSEYNYLFKDAKIHLEPYYYYETDYHSEIDGEKYSENWKSSSQTPQYTPNFCNDIKESSIRYELLQINNLESQNNSTVNKHE